MTHNLHIMAGVGLDLNNNNNNNWCQAPSIFYKLNHLVLTVIQGVIMSKGRKPHPKGTGTDLRACRKQVEEMELESESPSLEGTERQKVLKEY